MEFSARAISTAPSQAVTRRAASPSDRPRGTPPSVRIRLNKSRQALKISPARSRSVGESDANVTATTAQPASRREWVSTLAQSEVNASATLSAGCPFKASSAANARPGSGATRIDHCQAPEIIPDLMLQHCARPMLDVPYFQDHLTLQRHLNHHTSCSYGTWAQRRSNPLDANTRLEIGRATPLWQAR